MMNDMKYSKRTLIKSALVVSLFILSVFIMDGCDGFRVGNAFLEKPPSTTVNQDTVFSEADKAKKFLWHTYESLPYGIPLFPNDKGPYDNNMLYGDPLAILTDIDQSVKNNGGNRYYYTGNYNAGQEAQTFLADHFKYNFYNSGAWAGIRESYIFINNVDRVPDMDEAVKKRLKAEARMIIAIQYAKLYRNYGGMFWIDHYYGPNEDYHLPRLTAKATKDSIVAMIDKAIPDLPFVLDDPSTEAGRLTKAGAMGLKCRVLLLRPARCLTAISPICREKRPVKSWSGWAAIIKSYGKMRRMPAVHLLIKTNRRVCLITW
jgi:hypothetical protein